MKEVLNQWRLNFGQGHLGCDIGKEANSEFASFAARELHRRFHFLIFFVVVIRYNSEEEGSKLVSPDVCYSTDYSYFKYYVKHPVASLNTPLAIDKYKGLNYNAKNNKAEKIFILVTYVKNGTQVDSKCVFSKLRTKLNCQASLPAEAPPPNSVICHVKNPIHFCGHSWTPYPFTIKACLPKNYSMVLATCY